MLQPSREHRSATTSTEGSSAFAIATVASEVLSVVDGLGTAEAGRTCILLWRGVVTESRFVLQRAALEHVTSRHPGKTGILCIIEPTSEPPPQALREAAAMMLSQLAPKLRCMACVIEGDGFRAAMIRGVLSGIELLRRASYPTRYFATVAEASAWLAPQTGDRRATVVDGAVRLRERLDDLG